MSLCGRLGKSAGGKAKVWREVSNWSVNRMISVEACGCQAEVLQT